MKFSDQEKIDLLRKVLAFRSVNDGEEAVALYLQQLLKEHGIASQLVTYKEGRASLVADIKGTRTDGEQKVLVFSGHLDVVDPGDESDWTFPPFAGEIHDGKLYGRGTSDMKAGLVDLILAAIELKEEGADFSGTLRLALTVGEEVGMYGSKQLVDEGYLSDANGFLIAEPSGSDRLLYAHKGSLQYEIVATGKTAHSSMPEHGVDALQLMVDYIQLVNKKFNQAFNSPAAFNEELGRTINVHTVIEGGSQINSVAGKVLLQANARTVPEANNNVVMSLIQEAMEELNQEERGHLTLHVLQDNPPADSTKDNPLIQAVQGAANETVCIETLPGATDASNFSRIEKPIDLVIYGPGQTALAHQVDEFIEVDKFLAFVDLYKTATKTYLNGREEAVKAGEKDLEKESQ